MCKKIQLLFWFCFISFGLIAQEQATVSKAKKVLLKQDQLLLDFNWGTLLNKSDSLKLKPACWGFNLGIMLDNPLQNANFSFAAGIGLSTHNFYSNSEIKNFNYGTDSAFSNFVPISATRSYKRNKLNLTFFDIPFELRYRSKPNAKGFSYKVSVGGKVSYMLSTHSKIIEGGVKYKGFDYPNMENWRFGLMARVAYGKVGISGYYSISSIFDQNKGEIVNPFTIGITLTPF
jgi:hypothetical protein